MATQLPTPPAPAPSPASATASGPPTRRSLPHGSPAPPQALPSRFPRVTLLPASPAPLPLHHSPISAAVPPAPAGLLFRSPSMAAFQAPRMLTESCTAVVSLPDAAATRHSQPQQPLAASLHRRP